MTTPLVGPTSSSYRGAIAVAREDITPPPGIFARCWGASKHEVAAGVHRPLTLTTLAIGAPAPLVLISADMMSWRSRAAETAVIGRILEQSAVPRDRFMFCLAHTHSAPGIRPEDKDKTGGELIEPYQQAIVQAALRSIQQAQASQREATITWRYGRCDLATNRDLPMDDGRIVCGFNPAQRADDTVLVGRIAGDDGTIIATIVNYACHPTTLGPDNRLLSPDYVGAMRELVETHTNAPCLFLQGASGELAPAEQYSDDPALADRHGRRLGYAVLSTLQAMEQPGHGLQFDRVIESGAPLATWRQQRFEISTELAATMIDVQLPLKQMPSIAQIDAELQTRTDPVLRERLTRKRAVRAIVGDGTTTSMPLWAWRIGDALMIGQPNEAYSRLQIELRSKFKPRAVAVMNLVNGSAGYLVPRELCGHDSYQAIQSPYAAGAFEHLLAAAEGALSSLNSKGDHDVTVHPT